MRKIDLNVIGKRKMKGVAPEFHFVTINDKAWTNSSGKFMFMSIDLAIESLKQEIHKRCKFYNININDIKDLTPDEVFDLLDSQNRIKAVSGSYTITRDELDETQ